MFVRRNSDNSEERIQVTGPLVLCVATGTPKFTECVDGTSSTMAASSESRVPYEQEIIQIVK